MVHSNSGSINSRMLFIPLALILVLSIGCDDSKTSEIQVPKRDVKEYPKLESAISVKTIPLFSQWALSCGACNVGDSSSNFNGLMPAYNGPNQTQCGHADAGCVAVAMGQILNYWRKPGAVDWSKVKDTCSTRETAKLLSIVGKSLKMIYNVDQSGSSGIPLNNLDRINNSFDEFGFTSEATDFDLNKAIAEIDLGRPVMLIGCSGLFCHAWIASAYSIDQDGNYYLYMNWGLDYNSWSPANEWSAAGTIFSENKKMIYNIRPY